jgi:MsuE subfamily FMN reductase
VLDVSLAAARNAHLDVETEVLELRDLKLDFCDGRPLHEYNADTQAALSLVEAADAYLVATPIYRASYTGALKNLFDLIPNDPSGSDPLRGKVVGLLATGGSDHHFLVLEHQLRPLFGFFGAQTDSRAVYASPKDFNPAKQVEGKLVGELERLGQEVVALAKFLTATPEAFRPEHLRIRRDK